MEIQEKAYLSLKERFEEGLKKGYTVKYDKLQKLIARHESNVLLVDDNEQARLLGELRCYKEIRDIHLERIIEQRKEAQYKIFDKVSVNGDIVYTIVGVCYDFTAQIWTYNTMPQALLKEDDIQQKFIEEDIERAQEGKTLGIINKIVDSLDNEFYEVKVDITQLTKEFNYNADHAKEFYNNLSLRASELNGGKNYLGSFYFTNKEDAITFNKINYYESTNWNQNERNDLSRSIGRGVSSSSRSDNDVEGGQNSAHTREKSVLNQETPTVNGGDSAAARNRERETEEQRSGRSKIEELTGENQEEDLSFTKDMEFSSTYEIKSKMEYLQDINAELGDLDNDLVLQNYYSIEKGESEEDKQFEEIAYKHINNIAYLINKEFSIGSLDNAYIETTIANDNASILLRGESNGKLFSITLLLGESTSQEESYEEDRRELQSVVVNYGDEYKTFSPGVTKDEFLESLSDIIKKDITNQKQEKKAEIEEGDLSSKKVSSDPKPPREQRPQQPSQQLDLFGYSENTTTQGNITPLTYEQKTLELPDPGVTPQTILPISEDFTQGSTQDKLLKTSVVKFFPTMDIIDMMPHDRITPQTIDSATAYAHYNTIASNNIYLLSSYKDEESGKDCFDILFTIKENKYLTTILSEQLINSNTYNIDEQWEIKKVNTFIGGTQIVKSDTILSEELQMINGSYYHMSQNEDFLVNRRPYERFNDNIEAIHLLKQIQNEGRYATPEEQNILVRYSGWGGLGEFFKDSDCQRDLRTVTTEQEYHDIMFSRKTAFYTPYPIIDTMWEAARRIGFTGGKILEGSAGVGNILHRMPREIEDNSIIKAVEIEPLSGGILNNLYPGAVSIDGFQNVKINNNTYDLAISNVPFSTSIRVYDKGNSDLSRRFPQIHNFCIAKSVRKLKEGGIGIFITSTNTLDSQPSLINYIINEGESDFIGAFRLNNETFASEGTSVSSDIIIIRKRINNIKSANAIDLSSNGTERTIIYNEKPLPLSYNNYFIEHPECMGGKMCFLIEKGSTRFGGTARTCEPSDDISQEERLSRWIETLKPEELSQSNIEKVESIGNAQNVDQREGTLLLHNGNICIVRGGEITPIDIQQYNIGRYTQKMMLSDYIDLKNALFDITEYEKTTTSEAPLDDKLKALNEAYDTFVRKYGTLTHNPKRALRFLWSDVDYVQVSALENVEDIYQNDKKTYKISKSDIFFKRVIEVKDKPKISSIKDAVIYSVQQTGDIDIPLIKEVYQNVVNESIESQILTNELGYIDPITQRITVKHKYLCGNLREKIDIAKSENKEGLYDKNIKALEETMPLDIPLHLIEMTLGTPFIPVELYTKFIKEKLDIDDVHVNNVEGRYVFSFHKGRYSTVSSIIYTEENKQNGYYSGTLGKWYLGTDILLAAMNHRVINCKKTEKYGGETRVLVDKQGSEICNSKKEVFVDMFSTWIKDYLKENPSVAQQIESNYNNKFNSDVPLKISEEFLPKYLDNQNKNIQLYKHQLQAIMRATMQPTLFAHEVGSGKTFSLIATAMEMRRLGTAKKPMIVVQSATLSQFIQEAKKLYPAARICSLSDADNNPQGRQAFFSNVKYNDWDLIILSHSTLNMIPDSEKRVRAFIDRKIEEKLYVIEKLREKSDYSSDIDDLVLSISNEITKLQQDKEKKNSSGQNKNGLTIDAVDLEVIKASTEAKTLQALDRKIDVKVEDFDEMGIDALLVDEAHNYKHLGFTTTISQGVKGVDPSYSKRAESLFLKMQAVYEKTNGKNVVLATGTPISNTTAEIWTFMKYLLTDDKMKQTGMYYFDDFTHGFGNILQSSEFATDGNYKTVTRFMSYVNMPELMRTWSECTHTVLTKDTEYINAKIPDCHVRILNDSTNKYENRAEDFFLEQTPSLRSIMRSIRHKLSEFEAMSPSDKRKYRYIPLQMFTLAKQAAIDPRLINPDFPDEEGSKTNQSVNYTLSTLQETAEYNGTIAIFCDNYQYHYKEKAGEDAPEKNDFNIFNDIRDKLIAKGVGEEKIFIMKSGMSLKAKQEVFDKVNKGMIRVIMGTTATLGTGVNIQERLNTVIHLDAPTRPMDYEQRNGRILRQGNRHKEWNLPVKIIRYGVKDSLDITAYQRLKIKLTFIEKVMNGAQYLDNNQINRVIEEEEEGVFDNPVAHLSGSQYALKLQIEQRQNKKYQNRKKAYDADQIYIKNTLPSKEREIKEAQRNMAESEEKRKVIQELFKEGFTFDNVVIGMTECKTAEELEVAVKDTQRRINDKIDIYREDNSFSKGEIKIPIVFGQLQIEVKAKIIRSYDLFDRKITMNHPMTYDIPQLGLTNVPVLGGFFVNAIKDIRENVITCNDLQEKIETQEKVIKRTQIEIDYLKERFEKPFEWSKELEESTKRVDEYTILMKKELKNIEARYAQEIEDSENSIEVDIDELASIVDIGELGSNKDEEENMYDNLSISNDSKEDIEYVKQLIQDSGIDVKSCYLDENDRLGYVKDNTIFINENADVHSVDTLIHEYTHIFMSMMYINERARYDKIIKTLKGSELWQEVINDNNYHHLRGDDARICSEVLARYSGKRGAEKMRQLRAVPGRRIYYKLRSAVTSFWQYVSHKILHRNMDNSLEGIAEEVFSNLISRNPLNDTVNRENENQQFYDFDVSRPKTSPTNEFINLTNQGNLIYSYNNMQSNYLTFKELRSRISIMELAQNYGYVVVPGQGLRVPILEHPSGDKIGIFNPNDAANQGYFSLHNDADKGSLYNFIVNKVSMGIIPNPVQYPNANDPNHVVNKIAHDYLSIPIDVKEKNRAVQQYIKSKGKIANVEDFNKYLTPLTSSEYMCARGFDDIDIISSDTFKDRIYQADTEKMYEDKILISKNSNQILAFPLYKDEKVVGLEIRAENLKRFVAGSNKAEGVWHSNIPQTIGKVVVTEAPFDSIAHAVLHKKDIDKTLYISTMGNVCTQQIAQISNILKNNQDRIDKKMFEYLLCNDNDLAGSRFNLSYIKSQISLKDKYNVEDLPSQHEGTSQIMITYPSKEEKEEKENVLRKLTLNNDQGYNINQQTEDMEKSIVLQYQNGNIFAVNKLSEDLIRTTPLPRTKIQHAVLKDFNEDLMALNYINSNSEDFSYQEFCIDKEIFLTDCKAYIENKSHKKTATQKRNEEINNYTKTISHGKSI